MKKIIITAYNLDIGGIETALINLLKSFDYKKVDVTFVLEKAEGIFMNKIPKEVKLINYNLCCSKNIIYRKIKNRLKLIYWQFTHKNKYDFSISFATYSIVGSRIALNASKNNAIWIHGNYYKIFDQNKKKLNAFFKSVKLNKFKNHVFVSKENKDDIVKNYSLNGNQYVINNIIDGQKIIELSKEKINLKKDGCITFINVSRHNDSQKKISDIINAAKKLVDDGYKFKILMIGDGPDNSFYKELVKKYKLDKTIVFLGKKSNPFPYYKISDAVVLSSVVEGFPVVFNEARVLNIPIITTKVSDYKDIEKKYGIVVEQGNIYKGLKEFLEKGFVINKKFDYQSYNNKIIKKIEKIIGED